jgi:hypothetical protein
MRVQIWTCRTVSWVCATLLLVLSGRSEAGATAAWAALRDRKRAIALLRERLDRKSLSKVMIALMSSLLAVLEGRADEAVRLMEATDTTREPEILMYFARHYAQLRLADSAVMALKRAAQSGFICAPNTLNSDAWLNALREHSEFGSLLSTAETLTEKARSSFEASTASPKNWPFVTLPW